MKLLNVVARWIFILCLPVFLLSVSLAWGFNSRWLYEYGFQKYSVSQNTSLPAAELQKAAQGLIDYFNSGEEYVHITVNSQERNFELFSPEEQIHFKDVKWLVRLDYGVAAVTLAVALIYLFFSIFGWQGRYRRQLARSFIWGSVLSVLLIALLGVASVLDFDRLFLQFHYLVFTNPHWSAPGYMLLLFPGGFWFDAALICIGFMAALAFLMGLIAIIYLRSTRNGDASENVASFS